MEPRDEPTGSGRGPARGAAERRTSTDALVGQCTTGRLRLSTAQIGEVETRKTRVECARHVGMGLTVTEQEQAHASSVGGDGRAMTTFQSAALARKRGSVPSAAATTIGSTNPLP